MVDRLLSVVCWWFRHNYVLVSSTEVWCTRCHNRADRAPAPVYVPVEFTPMELEAALAELRADRVRERQTVGA